jgi:hypothetical protein
MYHPYFRGKQFELITIRESASTLARAGFVPIIEPVRESLGGLERTLTAVWGSGGKAVVIVNPYHGDHREDGVNITSLLQNGFLGDDSIAAGVLLRPDTSLGNALDCYAKHQGHQVAFVHAGFAQAKALAEALGGALSETRNVFIEVHCNKLYRRHFIGSERILIRDGFKKRKNADYTLLENFSDLHITYTEDGMQGFGDFLIVGDDFSEGGGPAYAVAIHLTFIDPDQDDAMFIYHFVSTTKDTLIKKLDSGTSKLLETSAIKEFRDLHAKGHFPGLGYVKKLSMKHHIETLADYRGP